jgi:hypothetical protein
LRKWFVLGIGLVLVVMWTQTSARAGEVVISGLITNWYQVKGRVPEQAYFQVVKKEHKLRGDSDKAGLAAFKSDLPRIPVRKSGGFRVKLGQVPPGEYFIALQRGFASAPIVVKDGKPLIFKVPGRFPLNVGNVQLELPLGQEPQKAHMIVVE